MSGQNPQPKVLGGYKEKSGTNPVEREREREEVCAHTPTKVSWGSFRKKQWHF